MLSRYARTAVLPVVAALAGAGWMLVAEYASADNLSDIGPSVVVSPQPTPVPVLSFRLNGVEIARSSETGCDVKIRDGGFLHVDASVCEWMREMGQRDTERTYMNYDGAGRSGTLLLNIPDISRGQ